MLPLIKKKKVKGKKKSETEPSEIKEATEDKKPEVIAAVPMTTHAVQTITPEEADTKKKKKDKKVDKLEVPEEKKRRRSQ